MDKINRVDTIELLKSFWELISPEQFSHFSEDKKIEIITGFIKSEFPLIENPLKHIWNIVLINKD
jgi:hypothetical protein